MLTWALCSRHENFEALRLEDDGSTAVCIGNPATAEFEVCRTSLLPGALKTLGEPARWGCWGRVVGAVGGGGRGVGWDGLGCCGCCGGWGSGVGWGAVGVGRWVGGVGWVV